MDYWNAVCTSQFLYSRSIRVRIFRIQLQLVDWELGSEKRHLACRVYSATFAPRSFWLFEVATRCSGQPILECRDRVFF